MKIVKIFTLFFSVCLVLSSCIQNSNNSEGVKMRFGKNITIRVSNGEIVDSEYLRNVIDGTIKKDIPYFNLLDDTELLKMIRYMEENNYVIKPGVYELNQSWIFDEGEFILNNGIKERIFEFQSK